jgi:hypothetical protein
MPGEWWGFVFLMLVMKAPIVYLAGVVWYACKPPDPPEPVARLAELPEGSPEPWCPWRRGLDPDQPRPHAPRRRVPAARRVSSAYARHR